MAEPGGLYTGACTSGPEITRGGSGRLPKPTAGLKNRITFLPLKIILIAALARPVGPKAIMTQKIAPHPRHGTTGAMLSEMSLSRSGNKVYTEDELYEYAVGALARRMRTVVELKRLLRRKVEAESELGRMLVELIIRRLKNHGYLNDAEYAASYSCLRRDNEKFGQRRVITDLKARGVPGEVIEQAVSAAYGEVDEERQARAYLRRKRLKKPKDQKQAGRIFRQLLRAGFGTQTIFTILKNWEVDDDLLTALEGETQA